MAERLPFGKLLTLSNGNKIPQLGLGVYEAQGKECQDAVYHALKSGYRLIDSAEWYGNERDCGQAIRMFMNETGTPRSDIFYTTKLQRNSAKEGQTSSAIKKSLQTCGLEYLDMYLIHSPYPNARARLQSWKEMEGAVQTGLVKNIGVSNYAVRHIEELLAACRIAPVVNQIDIHPFMTRSREVEYNHSKGILLEAWGPLVRGERMDNKMLVGVAQKYGKTPAQILVRWSLQRGFICIPKSVRASRIKENCDVYGFELEAGEVEALTGLDEYLVTDWDPIGDESV